MSKIITSNCEREFLYKTILKGCRLDGRTPFDGRDIVIAFGIEDGSCIVMQGNTRVMAVVTCEISSSKPSRPAEGILYINLDLSPMAAPNLKSGRMFDTAVEASRQLERCVRDSKCIDLESLCVVAGLKVWCIRVNIQVLNNDGNYIECASIACISALAHFKRPDVTVVGTDVIIHSLEDRNPVPLSLHHMPVIVNLALYDEGLVILVDPLEMEERIAPGKVIIGINAHQEICSWHLSGVLMLSKETTVQCMNIAVKRAQKSTQLIRSALDTDKYNKSTNQHTGFVSLMRTGTILGAKHMLPRAVIKPNEEEIDVAEDLEMSNDEQNDNTVEAVSSPAIKQKVRKFLQIPQVAVFEGGKNRWQLDEDESSEDENLESKVEGNEVVIDDSDESNDEDKKHIAKIKQVNTSDNKTSTTRGWYSRNAFL